ncbi:M20 aminoacylase family protein [Methylobacillus pratensis]
MANLIPDIVARSAEFKGIRRLLHAHPETAFEEHETGTLIASKLNEWGIEVHCGIGGTGVVGVLRGRPGDKCIGLRADMDALPMQEGNSFAHCSRYREKMHACGHDGHVAMLLAAARQLAESSEFKGTVNFIFQPAEEGGSGAKRMIADGLFERFPCDAVFALHNWPGLAAGTFATRPGPIMASCNEFNITIHGKGGHAAIPQQSNDPILAAAQVVSALQSVVSRNISPLDSVVLSVTRLQAGTGFNIIPDSAQIGGTVRTFSLPVLDMMEKRMESICKLTAQAHGCSAEFRFLRQSIPTVNDAEQTALALDVMRSVVGQDQVNAEAEPTMGAEDFAFMLAKRPGCYAFIGNDAQSPATERFGLHHPRYDFNDDLIPLGASYWVKLVNAFLD